MSQINFGFWSRLSQPIVGLSPMDGVTDVAFRDIVHKYGSPDVMFTEFVAVEGLAHSATRLLDPFLYQPEHRPIVAQVFGVDVPSFRVAALIVAALGFDGLDINMGCPAKKVSKRGAGAGLIKTPELAHSIIKACRQGLEDWSNGMKLDEIPVKEKVRSIIKQRSSKEARALLPLSVKTRIGYDRAIEEEWAEFLSTQNLAAITWHGRTLSQMYLGEADWDAIGRAATVIKKKTTSLVLGNGDLMSRRQAQDRASRYGLNGALIGRASVGNPWVFKDHVPTLEEKVTVAIEHAYLQAHYFSPRSFSGYRRHLAAYIKDMPNAATLRGQLMRAESPRAVEEILLAS